MKPFFSEKGSRENNITLIEDDVIVSDDFQIAETLNTYYSEAVESLNVRIPWKVTTDTTNINDPIDAIILKYSNHPSILKIKQVIKKGKFSFAITDLAAIDKEFNDIDTRKACKV